MNKFNSPSFNGNSLNEAGKDESIDQETNDDAKVFGSDTYDVIDGTNADAASRLEGLEDVGRDQINNLKEKYGDKAETVKTKLRSIGKSAAKYAKSAGLIGIGGSVLASRKAAGYAQDLKSRSSQSVANLKERSRQRKINKSQEVAIKMNEEYDEQIALEQSIANDQVEANQMNEEFDRGVEDFNTYNTSDIDIDIDIDSESESYQGGWNKAQTEAMDELQSLALEMNEQFDDDKREQRIQELLEIIQQNAKAAQERKDARKVKRQERIQSTRELPGKAVRKIGRSASRSWKAAKAGFKGARQAARQSLSETA